MKDITKPKTNKQWYAYPEFGSHYRLEAGNLLGCPTKLNGTPETESEFDVDFDAVREDIEGELVLAKLLQFMKELEDRE
ncbi:MAG TPA: hypothetical protein VIJ25_18535 [Methylococcales bacterium]